MDINKEIERQLDILVQTVGASANVPKDTGNLRSAIKWKRSGKGQFQIYIDEEQAPYAQSVEEMKPFWNRVAMLVSYRLSSVLGQGRREDTPNKK